MEIDGHDNVIAKVQASIETYRMPVPGTRVVVGVSGGADSVALLYALQQLGYDVVVAHLNHKTRGAESDADENFVRELAATLNLACETDAQDVLAEAKRLGVSFEEHARTLRYTFFGQVAVQHNATAIATAHHADDQAETVLMRILRGTGPDGLAGIPPMGSWAGLQIMRPLLECSHAEICAWLESQGVSWREDESNKSPAFLRNRIRHHLLPHLESAYNPQVRDALLRLADAQRCDNDYWKRQIAAVLPDTTKELDHAAFKAWPEALQRRVLLHLAHQETVDMSQDRLLALVSFVLDSATGASCDVGGGWSLYNSGDRMIMCHDNEKHSADLETVSLPIPGECNFLGKVFTARILDTPPPDNLKVYCSPTRQVFDLDKVSPALSVRSRKDGDRLVPFGLEGHKKVKDLLIEKNVPAPYRDAVPLVLSGDEIIWVVGLVPAQWGAVTPATKCFLEIGVRDAPV